MKSLELKALKMNDNFPLIISLNGKVEWELDDNKDTLLIVMMLDAHFLRFLKLCCILLQIKPKSDQHKLRQSALKKEKMAVLPRGRR